MPIIDPIKTEKRIITHSEMQTAKTCLRKHYLAYQLKLQPVQKAKYLRVGTLVHIGLDLYKKNTPSDDIFELMDVEYQQYKPLDADKIYDWEIECVTINALLSGYFWRWSEMPLKVIASEQEFCIPITNPASMRISRLMEVAGKIDGIVELSDGRQAVIEHKTAGEDISLESDYWKRLRIDSQISQYVLAARCLYAIDTVLYDVIRKPTISLRQIPMTDNDGVKIVLDINTGERLQNKNGTWKQSVNDSETQKLQTRPETPYEFQDRLLDDIHERPDYYYVRREIPRLEADLEEYEYELWQMAKILHECEIYGRYPRNTGACIGFGKCPFFDLCTTGYDINSGIVPDGFEIKESVHSELITA